MNSYNRVVLMVFIITVFTVFVGRLFYIQVIDSSYIEAARNNAIKKLIIRPARGSLIDRKGKLMVINRPFFDIKFVPKNLPVEFDSITFCRLMDLEPEYFTKRMAELRKQVGFSMYRPQIFISQLSVEEYAKVQEGLYHFPQFYAEKTYTRNYPYGSGGQIFGYLGEINQEQLDKDETQYYNPGDYVGITGIEKEYEERLRGVKGISYQYFDVKGRPQGRYKDGAEDVAAKAGENLQTSLDIELQTYAEKLMSNKIGSVVAIDPSTGEVLCFVSAPTFDPNKLVGRNRGKTFASLAKDPLKPLFNRPIKGASYPPGSTFKAINGLIGLQRGVIDVHTTFNCFGGYNGAIHVGCHAHRSPVDFEFSIQTSCNAYYCNVFLRMIDRDNQVDRNYKDWYAAVQRFGIGKKTGIDLPGEVKGNLPTAEFYDKVNKGWRWRGATILSLAIGQGELGVSPIQMANYACAIANRGHYFTPHIIRKSPKNKVEKYQTGVQQEYFNYLVDAMEKVIEGGTGTIAKIPGVSMCGKTGTAENPHGEDHSIFIAFAPKDNPKIAIATYVENAGFGATWAAPISSLLIEKYLHDSISRPALEKRMLEGSLLHKYPGYVNPNPPATKPGENGDKPKPNPTDTLKPQAVWPVNRKTLSSTSIAQR
ncbi:MAG: hypothetical protein RLY64_712 [Bacteroidota bacterium]|jgi:penicillin-binding protein 2